MKNIIVEHVCWNSNPRLLIIVCRPWKTNVRFLFPFAAIKRKFAVSVFSFQQTNRNCRFLLVPLFVCVGVLGCVCVCVYLCLYLYFYLYAAISNGKQKTEAQTIFLNPFTVCSSWKRKFVICPFLDKETNRWYLFANGLNGLNGLAHLWKICVNRAWWHPRETTPAFDVEKQDEKWKTCNTTTLTIQLLEPCNFFQDVCNC